MEKMTPTEDAGPDVPNKKGLARNSSWRRWRRLIVVKPKCKHQKNEYVCVSSTWYVNLGGPRTQYALPFPTLDS